MSQNKPRLPTDCNGRTVHIPFRPGGAVSAPISLVSGMTSTLANLQSHAIVRLVAQAECWFLPVQSSGVVTKASGHYLPANLEVRVILHNENRIAVLGSAANAGTLYVSECASN